MNFIVIGLDPEPFSKHFGLPDADLAKRGIQRIRAGNGSGFPDRVELRDLQQGEYALLLNHIHLPSETPYRACHAIFVREGAQQAARYEGEMPPSLRTRLLSLRAFSAGHMMVDADVSEGVDAPQVIARMLDNPEVGYLHAHYARPGCFAALIRRS
ncbi:MAG: DUF1203 domain-containing protein [Oceanicaulis sp.]|nr:DUF1203 domain-containing protein [Oceanicaulis sp.]